MGFLNSKITVYRNFTHLHAKIYFSILDFCNLNYYVFSGTSIGYVINKQNIPWADDYDIIIFDEDITVFENIVIPLLNKYGFCIYDPKIFTPCLNSDVGKHVLSHEPSKN